MSAMRRQLQTMQVQSDRVATARPGLDSSVHECRRERETIAWERTNDSAGDVPLGDTVDLAELVLEYL